jgi:haloacetate dehalogenase
VPILGQRFRVIAPDLRGIGDSVPQNAGHEKRTSAADIRGLLDAMGRRSLD